MIDQPWLSARCVLRSMGALSCLLVLLAFAVPAQSQDVDHEAGVEFPVKPSAFEDTTGAKVATPCQGGTAGPYPCRDIDLLAEVSLATLFPGAQTGSDLWGWTDSRDGVEYALMTHSHGVTFVNLADPANPRLAGTLPTQSVPSPWRDVKVYQNFAFVVSEAPGHGMQVFNLRRLRDVTNGLQVLSPAARYAGFTTARNIAINEETGFAYAVTTPTCGPGGLHMIDLRDPRNPVFAGVSGAMDSHPTSSA